MSNDNYTNNSNNTNNSAPVSPTPGPSYGGGYPNPDEKVMTVGEWAITILIMMIPCVNIVMLFMWAFGSSGNLNRKNLAKAYLIFIAIWLVIIIVFSIIAGLMGAFAYM